MSKKRTIEVDGIEISVKETEFECVWNTGGACHENVWEVEMFDNQISVPICENHLRDHIAIMTLHAQGYDVEKILNSEPEWRREEILTVKLSGLDNTEVKI